MYQPSTAPMTARPETGVPFVAQPGARSGGTAVIAVTIQRLEEIVDQETTALRGGKTVDLKEFNNRKSQALLELTRALRQVQGAGPDPALAGLVGTLKVKLAVNQAALQMHLEAVREISTSLSDAIRQAESDGTYTQAISSSARRL